jgi:hypothetical protein
MDRYSQFGLRGDEDDLFRRAVRDGFKRAGLGNDRLTQALEWFRDSVRPGMDEAKLTESFNEFAASKGWPAEQLTAAVAVYGAVRDQGPAAVLAPAPSPEEDVATIGRADELLRTNADAYWRDHDLHEAVLEARERQQAAPPPEPGIDPYAIERRIAEGDVDKFARMMREEPGKYGARPSCSGSTMTRSRPRSRKRRPARRPHRCPRPPLPWSRPRSSPRRRSPPNRSSRRPRKSGERVAPPKGTCDYEGQLNFVVLCHSSCPAN